MNFVITGGTGWLGQRVVRAVTQGHAEMGDVGVGGHRVRVLVQSAEDVSELISCGAELVRGDVRDSRAVEALFSGMHESILIHLAAVIHPRRSTREFWAVNVLGSRNIVEAAARAGVRRAVVLSSNSAIGASKDPAELFDEESPYAPYMGYGRSKHQMEEWLRAYKAVHSVPEITVVRAPWFYGPGQPKRQTTFFSMIRHGSFPLVGRGEARRSMAYVDSLAYGLLLAAGSPRAIGETYWLADERPYPMCEVVDTVRAVLRDDFGMKVTNRTLHVPSVLSDIARVADWALQRTHFYSQRIHVLSEMNLTIACVIEKAKRDYGYRPLVELREGMRRSVEWCISHNIAI